MKIKSLLALVAVLAFAPFAAAEKVVVLDVNTAVLETEYAKKKIKEFEASEEIIAMKSKFDALSADLQAMDKEAQANGLTWSEEQRTEHAKKKAFVQQNLQLTQKQFQTAQKVSGDQIFREVQPKLSEALKQVVDAQGVDLVLHAQAVLIAGDKANITKDVVDALNKTMKKSK